MATILKIKNNAGGKWTLHIHFPLAFRCGMCYDITEFF